MSSAEGHDCASSEGVLSIQAETLVAEREFRLALRGELRLPTATQMHDELQEYLNRSSLQLLELDCGALDTIDTAGAAVLSHFARECRSRNITFRVIHLSDRVSRILSIMPQKEDGPASGVEDETTFETLGGVGLDGWSFVQQLYGLFTDTMLVTIRAMKGRFPPRGATTSQAVRIGVDALPIVALLSFLLGLVLAFQAADQLSDFGAEIYTANLVGIGMFREFGALLTGIVLAGRSGSSIAAELGTMKVNEEVDALHTMGIDHNRFLVLPRMIAIVLVQPALTLMSNVVGTLGGLLIGVLYLRIPAQGYWVQSVQAIRIEDFLQGMAKSVVFALLIGQIACFSGLSVSGGATGVGRATTRAVVASIFMIIVFDSIFTTISTLLG